MTKIEKKLNLDTNYLNWLAGLIDGDGCFTLSKKGYGALEITMEDRDIRCLYLIKDIFGGSVKQGAGKWSRYRIHNAIGLKNILNSINGRVRNPVRILQVEKLCTRYNIEYKDTSVYEPLSYDNSWLAGFIDADGSVYLNKTSVQIFISASQKDKYLLDQIALIYGGNVYPHGKVGAFKWTISKKAEVLNMLDYFSAHPLRSKKMVRVLLIQSIYEAYKKSYHKKPVTSIEGKKWTKLFTKWTDYEK